TAEGRKCGQLFSVEREGVSPQYVPPFMGPSLTVSPWAPSSPPLLCRRHRLSTCAGIGRIPPRLLHPELRLALPRRAKSVGGCPSVSAAALMNRRRFQQLRWSN